MRPLGLRPMLLGPLVLVLLVGSALLGVFIHRSVERDQIRAIDEELTRAIVVTVDDARFRPPRPAAPDGDDPPTEAVTDDAVAPRSVVIDPSGQPRPSSGDLAGLDLTPFLGTERTATVDGDPRLRATSRVLSDGSTAVVALSLEEVDRSLASLRRSLLLGTLVLVAVQAAIASVVVSSVKRPITRLQDDAHAVAEGELETTIRPGSGPAEVRSLAEDLGVMVDRLRSTIDEREAAATTAEAARSDMQRFLADASHELRTPLTAITGYADLHRNGMMGDDDIDRAMDRIGAESARLTELANDLLQMLRPTDPRSHDDVDLRTVAAAIAHDLRAAHPGHAIGTSIEPGDPTVYGDAARLHQAILNIAANACQHTPDGTEVDITIEPGTADVVIRIVDDGPGFPEEMRESAFDAFVRADRSRSRSEHDGAGLGMTIARRIVEQHGGDVALSDTPSGGATIVLTVPRALG